MATDHGTREAIVRPLKLIGFICACIAVLILCASMTTSYWLEGQGYRQGLWEACLVEVTSGEEKCSSITNRLWVTLCGVLTVLSLLTCLAAAVIAFVALLTRNNYGRKRRLNIAAGTLLLFALIFLLAALVLFPVMLVHHIEEYREKYHSLDWLFSWSYGLAWGAWLFIIGAAILLLINKKSNIRRANETNYYDVKS